MHESMQITEHIKPMWTVDWIMSFLKQKKVRLTSLYSTYTMTIIHLIAHQLWLAELYNKQIATGYFKNSKLTLRHTLNKAAHFKTLQETLKVLKQIRLYSSSLSHHCLHICIWWDICLLLSVTLFTDLKQRWSTVSSCSKSCPFLNPSSWVYFLFSVSFTYPPWGCRCFLLFVSALLDTMCDGVVCVSDRVQSIWSQNPWSTGADDEQQY